MNEEQKKSKSRGISLFLFFLLIALICFAIVAYLLAAKREEAAVNHSIVTISQILALTGIFFLVIAFGHVLPVMLPNTKASSIFNEANMRQTLGAYIPAGETLLAGIHAVSNETIITDVFGGCICKEDRLIPAENGGTVELNKKKYSDYDIYLGITQASLLIVGCKQNSYYYQMKDVPDGEGTAAKKITSVLPFASIGTCYLISDIQSCEMKKGWMGSVKCFLTMKNGSYFKLLFPKHGGISGEMPHHTEYREAIMMRLGGNKV